MLDRVYTIPLAKAKRAPTSKRAPKAIRVIREFLTRHMKSDEVYIGASINDLIWKNGIRRIPPRIRIHTIKNDEGQVRAELMGIDILFPEAKPEAEEAPEAPEEVAVEPVADAVSAEEMLAGSEEMAEALEAEVDKEVKAIPKAEKKAPAKKVEDKLKTEKKAPAKKAEDKPKAEKKAPAKKVEDKPKTEKKAPAKKAEDKPKAKKKEAKE